MPESNQLQSLLSGPVASLNRIPRLYSDAPLARDAQVDLDKSQSHYLTRVMRLKPGADVRLFNRDQGEWLCRISQAKGKTCQVECCELVAPPDQLPDVDYLFAPLKSARLDYLVQKATEMGVRRLQPVITERTVMRKVNLDRIVANTREAAEQCNMVSLPDVLPTAMLQDVLSDWDPERRLIFCDEAAEHSNPVDVLRRVQPGPLALLVGPEGGFAPSEQSFLRKLEFVIPVSLGPRIMRADTAAVAALAIVQSTLGDWTGVTTVDG